MLARKTSAVRAWLTQWHRWREDTTQPLPAEISQETVSALDRNAVAQYLVTQPVRDWNASGGLLLVEATAGAPVVAVKDCIVTGFSRDSRGWWTVSVSHLWATQESALYVGVAQLNVGLGQILPAGSPVGSVQAGGAFAFLIVGERVYLPDNISQVLSFAAGVPLEGMYGRVNSFQITITRLAFPIEWLASHGAEVAPRG